MKKLIFVILLLSSAVFARENVSIGVSGNNSGINTLLGASVASSGSNYNSNSYNTRTYIGYSNSYYNPRAYYPRGYHRYRDYYRGDFRHHHRH